MDVLAIISTAIAHDPAIVNLRFPGFVFKIIDDLVNSNLIMTWPDILDGLQTDRDKEHRVIVPINNQFGSMSQVHSDMLAKIDFTCNDSDQHDVFAGFLMFGAATITVPKKLSFVSFLKHDDKEHWNKVIVDLEDKKRLYLPIIVMYSNDITSIRETFAKIIDETFTAVETAAKITNV
jgi:hypothetical protein